MNRRARRWPPALLLLVASAAVAVSGPRAVAQSPTTGSVGSGGSSTASETPGGGDKAVTSAVAYCDQSVHQEGAAAMNGMKADIAALEALLAAATAKPAAPGAGGASANASGSTPPASPALTPTATTALTSALAEARQMGAAAVASHAAAEKALAEARTAKDPTMRAFHLKDAMLKEETAQRFGNQASKLARGIASAPSAPTSPAGAAGDLGAYKFNRSPTLDLLTRMAKTDSPEAWRQALQDKAAPAQVVAPRGNTFFGIKDPFGVKDYDAAADTVTLANGATISVEALRRAAARVDPAISREPLFRKEPPPPAVSMPATPGEKPADAWRLDRRVLAMIASPDTRKQMERVGGVALDVTLDVLAFARVAEFRPRGPATVVDAPVLVSLRALQQAAAAWAVSEDRWRALPDELRFPGAMERIHGFVLDPEHGDVVLVGAPAARRERRIDIDTLIVGIRTVWRDERTPTVSLDPLPQNVGGPQYPRITGVPERSAFAKIMLDADYAMKRIMGGTLRTSVPGFRTLPELLAAAPTAASVGARFWLTPRPLGPDSIRVAADGRMVLFDASLDVQTEEGWITATGFAGTGRTQREAQEAAAGFTAAYAAFEQAPQIEPAAVFTRVRALADIATVCTLWRPLGDVPVLRAFTQLPVLRLTGADAVPAYYPGVTVRYRRPEGEMTLSGGAVMRPRHSRRSLDEYEDIAGTRLSAAARDLAASGRVARVVPMTLVLAPPRPANQTLAAARVAGDAALRSGDHRSARDRFVELTAADPLDTDAWADLATTRLRLGETAGAAAAIARALALEPTSAWLQAIALDVALHSDPTFDLGRARAAARRELSADYTARAVASLTAGDETAARRLAETAIRLADDNADAYVVRAQTWSSPAAREASRDWTEAIQRYRARLAAGEEDARRPLAFALAMSATARLGRLDLSAIRDASSAQAAVDVLQRLADRAREARQLDDSEALAITAEAWARTLRVWIFKLQGRAFDTAPTRQLADSAVSRFPDFPPAHFVRALVALAAGDRGAALGALSEAIRLDPTYADALLGRAEVYVQERRCAEATQDVARARGLLRKDDPRPLDPRVRCG